MIRDFKAQIFCRENKLSKREIDTGDPVWIDRIDAFFHRTSLLRQTEIRLSMLQPLSGLSAGSPSPAVY